MRILICYNLLLISSVVSKNLKIHKKYGVGRKNEVTKLVDDNGQNLLVENTENDIVDEEEKAQQDNDNLTKTVMDLLDETLYRYESTKNKLESIRNSKFAVMWNRFKTIHSKKYENDAVELKRMGIFFDNVKKIKKHNLLYDDGEVSFKMGVNRFTDYTSVEFRNMTKCTTWENTEWHRSFYHNNLPVQQFEDTLKTLNFTNVPHSIDWRKRGVITRIKNQLDCGSCYAFAAIGTLEGHVALRYKRLIELSAQQIIDCSQRYGNCECKGGMVLDTYSYIFDHGIQASDVYPYEAKPGKKCLASELEIVMDISGASVIHGNETLMKLALNVGPIATFINGEGIQFYRGGIMSNYKCSIKPSQAVIIIGYGTDKMVGDYWIIKNSWGRNWGEGGYMRIERNKHFCGIGFQAYYPLL